MTAPAMSCKHPTLFRCTPPAPRIILIPQDAATNTEEQTLVIQVGTEWLVDALGCRPEGLRDPVVLQAFCDALLMDLDLRTLGKGLWHKFPEPGGLTGLYLLAESHLACHTYPEFGVATFNLYCCRHRAAWPWEQRLRDVLAAQRVTVRKVERAGTEGGGP